MVRNRMIYRLSTLAILVAMLTSCLASTDRLAVFEETALSQEQVDALSGYYGWVGEQGKVSSLIFVPRKDHWPYRPTPRSDDNQRQSAEQTLALASADFTFKSLTIFEDGNSAIFVLTGVAVFSKIPETELILVSIAGETLRTNNDDGSMEPASEQNASTNLFFVMQHDGKEIEQQFFSDDDQRLETAVGDPSEPLPAGELLDYLKAHAQERFLADERPTYRRSTPQQQRLIEQEMNAALSEDREEKTREPASSP